MREADQDLQLFLSPEADQALLDLVDYAVLEGLLPERDRVYAHNRLLELFQVQACRIGMEGRVLPEQSPDLTGILEILVEEACARGFVEADSITQRDLWDTRLMGAVTPPPSQVEEHFYRLWAQDQQQATDWFYSFSQKTNYIRKDRIQKDKRWVYPCEYGAIDITINRSKPEKDPRAIAAAGKAKKTGYPSCLLCADNEGYAGHMTHPARQNHRMIRLPLEQNNWFLQYSPYVYYNEHAIFLHAEHHPMKIDRSCLQRLLEIVHLVPHYFVGSNADLPIVGGSILAHEHFQGGHYTFAMEQADFEEAICFTADSEIEAGWVHWPLSVLRLRSENAERLLDLADRILRFWRIYDDPTCNILSHTEGLDHNTITPIARRRGLAYELDLVLRNNRTDEAHPWGIFHPRAAYHHIKKENIGLIEVMGLAVLPARLDEELQALAEVFATGGNYAEHTLTQAHAEWMEELVMRRKPTVETVESILREEVGAVFVRVLEDAGVYKQDAVGKKGKKRFLEAFAAWGKTLD